MTSNKLFAKAVAIAFLAQCVLPLAARAEEASTIRAPREGVKTEGMMRGDAKPTMGAALCERISAAPTENGARLQEMKGKVESARYERDERIGDRQDARHDKSIGIRAENDERINALSARLLESATTDAQKAAVTAFQDAVAKAVDARRAAIDKANDDFKAGLETAIASRKSAIDAAIAKFEAAVGAATAKAKADCAVEGADGAAIAKTMRASIEAARKTLQTERLAADKISASVKTLVETRKKVVEKAKTDFKTVLEKAKTDLKAAMPKPEEKEEAGE